jgi:hypothetical protein
MVIADSITDVMYEMERALQRIDADSILSFYARTDEFVNIESGEIVPWARMAEQVRAYARRVTVNDVNWVSRPTVVVLNRDAAVVYGMHRFGGGGGFPAHIGLWTGVLQRIAGRWRIVHAHGSEAKPSAPRGPDSQDANSG